ncbi:MAG: hypothetical protein HY293_10510 [Planctomycetes bacterium]|nr:hypothetical protein [Planctomycetota bacterium]
MKRAWKVVLAVVGIPALCFGLLAADSYYRAQAAIATQDELLARDIAALRTRNPSPRKGISTLEEGHSAPTTDGIRANLISLVLRVPNSDSGEGLLSYLAGADDQLREGGYRNEYYRHYSETRTLERLRKILESKPLEAKELRRFRDLLDRIEASRPSLADIVTGEYLLDRAEVLNVLHQKRDPYCMITRPPGWREFFSWRIMIAKALVELDDVHRQVLDLAKEERRMTNESLRTRTSLQSSVGGVFDRERTGRAAWAFTRLALALSLFQAEQGRDPTELKELVPEYLAELPHSPLDGDSYLFRTGVLHDVRAGLAWSLCPK